MLRFLSLLGLAHCALGYKWQYVPNVHAFPSDMVRHYDKGKGSQGVCRNDFIGGGRLEYNYCYGTKNGIEYAIKPSYYDVLVKEPLAEQMVWRSTYDASMIRAKGVQVKPPNSPEPSMHVCAIPLAGPGKLVIWGENDIVCYCGFGIELGATKNYQVLLTEPATKYVMREVHYDLDELSVISEKPVHLARANLINRDDNAQEVTHTLTYSKTSESSWESSSGFTAGVCMEVSAGVPALVGTDWEVSAESSWEYSYGKTEAETVEVSLEATVSIPPRHRCTVRINARRKVINVPYDGRVTSHFADGTSHSDTVSGVYDGVSVTGVLHMCDFRCGLGAIWVFYCLHRFQIATKYSTC